MRTNKILLIAALIIIGLIICTANVNATQIIDDFSSAGNWNIIQTGVSITGGKFVMNFNTLTSSYSTYTSISQQFTTFDMEMDIKDTGSAANSWPRYGFGLRNSGTAQFHLILIPYTNELMYQANGNQARLCYITDKIPSWTKGSNDHVRILYNGTSYVYVWFNDVYMGSVSWSPGATLYTPIIYDYTNSQYVKCEFDNFYLDTTGQQYLPTNDVTFKGYVNNSAGTYLQYANVSLYEGTTYIASDITDNTGYYEFTQTVNINTHYTMNIAAPNEGVGLTHTYFGSATDLEENNFTVDQPIGIKFIVADADQYISNYDLYITTSSGTTSWLGVTNFTYTGGIQGDTISVIIHKDQYLNYTYSMAVPAYDTVILAKLEIAGAYILQQGHTRDQIGVIIPNLPVYVYDVDNNLVDATVSTDLTSLNPGYYQIKVPYNTSAGAFTIKIDYPGYGLLTPVVADAGTLNTQATLTFPDDFQDQNGNVVTSGYDLLLNLGYDDTEPNTPTPTASAGTNLMTVTVKNDVTKEPVYHAYVSLDNNGGGAYTDSNGKAYFYLPYNTQYHATVTASGYQNYVSSITMNVYDEGSSSSYTLMIHTVGYTATPRPTYGNLNIYALQNDESPIEGAIITIAGGQTKSTDSNGIATFNLAYQEYGGDSKYYVTVTANGYFSQQNIPVQFYYGLTYSKIYLTASVECTNITFYVNCSDTKGALPNGHILLYDTNGNAYGDLNLTNGYAIFSNIPKSLTYKYYMLSTTYLNTPMLKQYENMNGTFVIGTEADYLINLTTNPYYNTNSIGGGVYYNSTLLMELEGYTPATVYLADNDGNILMTDDTDEYGVYYFVNIPSGHNGVAHLYSTYGGYTGYKNVSFATLYSQGGLFNQDIYIKNATVASSTARPPQDGDIIILGFNLNTCNPAIWALLLTAIAFVGTIVLLKDSTGAAQAGAVMAGITFCVTCLIGWIPIWIPFVIGLIILVIFGSKFFSTGG